jgi:hypothetical protein
MDHVQQQIKEKIAWRSFVTLDLRVVNGRISKDANTGHCTCYTHNGESLVVLLIM